MEDTKEKAKQKISRNMTPRKALQFLLLGLLWLVLSLPVITAGAATCAFFYVGIKILNDDPDIKTAKLFFKGIKQNFVQGLLMSLISIVTLGGFGALLAWTIISDQSKIIIFIVRDGIFMYNIKQAGDKFIRRFIRSVAHKFFKRSVQLNSFFVTFKIFSHTEFIKHFNTIEGCSFIILHKGERLYGNI